MYEQILELDLSGFQNMKGIFNLKPLILHQNLRFG